MSYKKSNQKIYYHFLILQKNLKLLFHIGRGMLHIIMKKTFFMHIMMAIKWAQNGKIQQNVSIELQISHIMKNQLTFKT